MLDFLSKHAQKAYKEIQQITEQPDLLFSNDPTLIALEARTNYRYIHGFTRLLRKGTLNIEDVTRSLLFVESKLDEYLKKIYKNKDFKFIIYGDIGIPGFTLTITSYYENHDDEGRFRKRMISSSSEKEVHRLTQHSRIGPNCPRSERGISGSGFSGQPCTD
ncbi:hypothetical protein [Paenibacillus durus]|uniref:hypothetical protein n=1 Tax=Paenibacillus durus TaxID=44251 RepID=UPI0004702F6C|nr:hypothetical protein [Paenibacillus durus]